jgi:hypothetical protein
MVRAADAVEMVLNVAETEANLVEVVQVINNFHLPSGPALVVAFARDAAKTAPKAENAP